VTNFKEELSRYDIEPFILMRMNMMRRAALLRVVCSMMNNSPFVSRVRTLKAIDVIPRLWASSRRSSPDSTGWIREGLLAVNDWPQAPAETALIARVKKERRCMIKLPIMWDPQINDLVLAWWMSPGTLGITIRDEQIFPDPGTT
jgi:hypothetical protein